MVDLAFQFDGCTDTVHELLPDFDALRRDRFSQERSRLSALIITVTLPVFVAHIGISLRRRTTAPCNC